MTRRLIVAGLALVAALAVLAAVCPPEHRPRPIVIAHRGASAYRPEETRSAYELAIAMGADYIEPDVVTTKDHVLVARHDNWLNDTTDVASHPEFARLRRTKTIDGVTRTDWFTEDFTFARLRTLRTRERLPRLRPKNTAYDGVDPIPSLEEVLRLARDHHVGVYPETKHPTYFSSIGLPLEDELLKELAAYGFRGRDDKVFIQSFETANLRALRRKTTIRLIQLIDKRGRRPYDFTQQHDPRTYDDLVTPAGLKWVATYADGVAPELSRVIPPTTLVRDAHRAGLLVHPFSVRPEDVFLPAAYRPGGGARLLAALYALGVDGVFSDDTALAVATRRRVFG